MKSHSSKHANIEGRLAFIRAAEKLKNVLRSGFTSQGRQESTAEHTWRLCLLAMVFADQLRALDFTRVLKLCVLHDLGEAISGDVPAIVQHQFPDKSERERRDLQQLLTPLEPELQAEFLALWDEYEQAQSAEARAVKALDKLETIIQHNQGANPSNFDYAFNLQYGQQYMGEEGLFAEIRRRVDEETRKRMEESAQT